ncbi:MAG: glycosyltransferase family 2 protein, partial [bacterium]
IIFSILFLIFGLIFGISSWLHSIQTGVVTTPGQVMIAALPLIFGLQFLLSFINFDISNVPKYPIHKLI